MCCSQHCDYNNNICCIDISGKTLGCVNFVKHIDYFMHFTGCPQTDLFITIVIIYYQSTTTARVVMVDNNNNLSPMNSPFTKLLRFPLDVVTLILEPNDFLKKLALIVSS